MGTVPPRYNFASLKGRSPPRVRFRPAQGSDAPSSEISPPSGTGGPLARGPVSIESRASPRASLCLARGYHGPAASITAPPAGALNALTFAGAQVKGESVPLCAWESCLGTAPPTPVARPSPPLCGMVSNNPVALYHPLSYGRCAAPSKQDGGALEEKTNNHTASVQGQRRDVGTAGSVTSVAIGPVRSTPSSPTPSLPLHRDYFPHRQPPHHDSQP
jgi:hypothetical protein